MKHYVVYDQQTGEILASGTCQDEDLELQQRPGTQVLEGAGAYLTHYVSDGSLVSYSIDQAVNKARSPSRFHTWSNETFDWVETRSQQDLDAELASAARTKRIDLLAASDWTDTLSAKTRLGDALYNAWQDYRQILRDVPQQAEFPSNIAWPDPPSPT